MSQGRQILLYNDRCSMCRDLASKVFAYSRESIETLPLTNSRAHELIHRSYGEKHPNSFFFITQDGAQVKAAHGVRAALRIAHSVGLGNSLRLLDSYLHYRGQPVAKAYACCGQNGSVDLPRRRSFRIMLKGGLALALAAIGLGSLAKTFGEPQEQGEELHGEVRDQAVGEALSSEDYRNVIDSLVSRGLAPQRAAAVAFEYRLDDRLGTVLSVAIPFGAVDLYSGYVLYRRKGFETVAISLLRLGASELQPLAMSVNRQPTGAPLLAASASCFTPPGSPNHICCPTGLRCCQRQCSFCGINCTCQDCIRCSCIPPAWFYENWYRCCTDYLCYDKNTGAPAGWQCTDPCDAQWYQCDCYC